MGGILTAVTKKALGKSAVKGKVKNLDRALLAKVQPVGKLTPQQPVGKLTPIANKERLQRAKDEGFDTGQVFYHGTVGDFEKFKPQPHGIFFSTDASFSNAFARRRALDKHKASGSSDVEARRARIGANIIPVYLKKGKNFDPSTLEADEVARIFKLDQNKNFERMEIDDILAGDWTTIESARSQRKLKEAGYDSYYVMEGETKNLAIFEPKNIRSVNAQFKNPSSADIIAGTGAAALTVSALSSEERQPVGKLTPVDTQ